MCKENGELSGGAWNASGEEVSARETEPGT